MDFEYQLVDSLNYDDRKNYLEKMCIEITQIKDDIDRDYYMHVLSQKSGFSYDIIQQRVAGMKPRAEEEYVHREVKKTIQIIDKYNKAEHDLCFIC